MKSQVYAIYDIKTQVFYPPFLAANDEHAGRLLHQTIRRQPNGEFAEFPADYQAFRIGTFDDSTAMMEAVAPAVLVFRLDQLVAREPEGQRVLPFPDRSAPPTRVDGGGR